MTDTPAAATPVLRQSARFLTYSPEPPPEPEPEPSFVGQELRALGLNCLIATGISIALGVIGLALGYVIGPL